jgi:hypothetical protein
MRMFKGAKNIKGEPFSEKNATRIKRNVRKTDRV